MLVERAAFGVSSSSFRWWKADLDRAQTSLALIVRSAVRRDLIAVPHPCDGKHHRLAGPRATRTMQDWRTFVRLEVSERGQIPGSERTGRAMRIGFVGTGAIARRHLMALLNLSGPNRDRLSPRNDRGKGQRCGPRVGRGGFHRSRRIPAGGHADAVFITVPPHQHGPISRVFSLSVISRFWSKSLFQRIGRRRSDRRGAAQSGPRDRRRIPVACPRILTPNSPAASPAWRPPALRAVSRGHAREAVVAQAGPKRWPNRRASLPRCRSRASPDRGRRGPCCGAGQDGSTRVSRSASRSLTAALLRFGTRIPGVLEVSCIAPHLPDASLFLLGEGWSATIELGPNDH